MSGSVTMYTTPWCGYCHRLKGQMDREGITYDVVAAAALALSFTTPAAADDHPQATSETKTTVKTDEHGQKRVTKTRTTTPVTAQVVRVEPATRTFVVKQADKGEVTYHYGSDVQVPKDLKEGSSVSLDTWTADDGGMWVHKVTTTTSVPIDGAVAHAVGVVKSYESGRTITIQREDGTMMTFFVDQSSQVPADLAVGRTITIEAGTSPRPLVRTITYR